MEIWEPKPPGSLWAILGLLCDSSYFSATDDKKCYDLKKHWRLCNNSSEADRSEINEESAPVAASNHYRPVYF